LSEGMSRDRVTVPSGSYVVLRVHDTGGGIHEDNRTKIFEPFWTNKKPGEGTGLGLSTAYGIIKQTGGYIFVDSNINVGTTFSILIPSHDAPLEIEKAVEVIDPVAPSKGDGVVLLVEDEAPVRAFASRALRLRGFTVLEADCAEMALSMLADPELDVDLGCVKHWKYVPIRKWFLYQVTQKKPLVMTSGAFRTRSSYQNRSRLVN